jgi:hypothetical protein
MLRKHFTNGSQQPIRDIGSLMGGLPAPEEEPTLEQLLADPWNESSLIKLEGWQVQVVDMEEPFFADPPQSAVVYLCSPDNTVVSLVRNSSVHQQLLDLGYVEVAAPQ